MSSKGSAAQAEVSPEKFRAARKMFDQFETTRATDNVLEKQIQKRNTQRFVNPQAYQSGATATAGALLQRQNQSISALDTLGSIQTQDNISAARIANDQIIRKANRQGQIAGVISGGVGAVTGGILDRQQNILGKGEDPIFDVEDIKFWED